MKSLLTALMLLIATPTLAKTVRLDLKGPVTEEAMWILKYKLKYHMNIGDVVYLDIDLSLIHI